MNLIPKFILSRIAHRSNLIKIVDNISWLFLDKILRMGVGLLVGVWIARYLGPEQFGLLNFAQAFTGLFGIFAVLGLQIIVVRDIVRDPESARLTLGTAALLQLIGGLISYLLILSVIGYLRPDDNLTRTIVAILGSTILFKFCEIALYWFESQVQSKYIIWVQNTVFLVFAVIKAFLILKKAPLIFFVWAMLIEVAVVAIILMVLMNRHGLALKSLRASTVRAKTLLNHSWPLFLSGFAIIIYMKIDQVMLGVMIDDKTAGIYSAATRISEIWYFIPTAILTSVFPAILESKKRSEDQYYCRMQKLYDLMVWMSIAIALPFTFIATPLIELLFGEAYTQAGTVLSIHIWSSVFVFLGVASGKGLVAENLIIENLQRTALGAIMNVVLNFILIPKYGVLGATWATVLSYATAALLSDLVQPQTRIMFLMKARAFNIIGVFHRNIGSIKKRDLK